MNSFLRIVTLLVVLAIAKAQFETESPEFSATQCDCRTLQTKLDQLELRVSKISTQLQQSIALTGHNSKLPFEDKIQYVDTEYGSKWIVILQRTEGKVNFNRTWIEYRNGFGSVGRDFWFGLVKLHQLTKSSPYELVVEMTDFEDSTRIAKYDRFEIGSEKYRYPIVDLGTHSGSAGDGLSAHKFVGFSTTDRDTSSKCSARHGNGGWWFNGEGCFESNLTGEWLSDTSSGLVWGKFNRKENATKLKSARMMIRAVCKGTNDSH